MQPHAEAAAPVTPTIWLYPDVSGCILDRLEAKSHVPFIIGGDSLFIERHTPMSSHRLSSVVFTFIAIASAAIPNLKSAWGGPTAYNFADYPTDQNGYHLSGQIVTDGVLGKLAASDITSWSFTITNTDIIPNINFTSSPTSSPRVMGVVATTTTLTLPYGDTQIGGISNQNLLLFNTIQQPSGGFLEYVNSPQGVAYCGVIATLDCWETPNPTMNNSQTWVIADGGHPVPEPSTLVLLGIGAVSLLAYAWRRRTKVSA